MAKVTNFKLFAITILFLILGVQSASSQKNFTISGRIIEADTGVAGIQVRLNGDAYQTTTTDRQGFYSFSVREGSTFNVTPEKEYYNFYAWGAKALKNNRTFLAKNPAGVKSYSNLKGNQIQNFWGIAVVYSISGNITNGGTALRGVTVKLTNAGTLIASTSTDSNGHYSLSANGGITYDVTPQKLGYSFTPTSTNYPVLSTDQTTNYTSSTIPIYTISGIAKDGSLNPISGVTVILSGSLSGTTTTDATGYYSIAVNSGGTYNIDGQKVGWTFTPPTINNPVDGDRTGDLSAAACITKTISGQVTNSGSPLSGTLLTLSGSLSGTQTTGADGNYSFTINVNRNYTVTPTKAGYIFSPTSQSWINITAPQTQNFTSTSTATDTVRGQVKTPSGSGISGATLSLTGSLTNTTTSDLSGNYLFVVNPNGNYKVTPSLTGYAFTPADTTLDTVTVNKVANFVGSTDSTKTISGTVTSGGSPLSSVTLTLSGDLSGTFTTGANGQYSFTVFKNKNYTITPSKSGYSFSPNSLTYNNLDSNRTYQDYSATSATTRTISGHINDNGIGDLAGVILTLAGSSSALDTTDAGGLYSFSVNDGGSYTVTPAKSGYTFTPGSYSYTSITSDTLVQNFTSASATTDTIRGVITLNGSPLSAVDVALSGTSSGSTVTDVSGNYLFTVNHNSGPYTVTPSKQGYTFNPSNQVFSYISSNQTQNFVATATATNKISGTIFEFDGLTPKSGVTVTLNGDKDSIMTTDGTGQYQFIVNTHGNYSVSPSLSYYSFNPTNISFNNIEIDKIQNFSLIGISISGTVKDGGDNPIADATVTLNCGGGPAEWTTMTIADGSYSFTNIGRDSNFVLSTNKAGWASFAPVNYTYSPLVGNQVNQNFVGTRATYSIGGTVTDGVLPIQNVTMTLTSGGITKWTATTAVDGTYSFATVGGDSNFVLTPSRGGWTFAPVTRSYTPITGNMAAQDFTGTRATYSIGGTVTDGVLPIQNVTMTLTSGGITKWTATTAVDGTYSFATIGGDSDFVLTPTKSGWTSFAPVTRTYTQLSGAQAAQDFTGTRATYSIGGTVTDGVLPIQNVTMTLTSGGITKWTATTAVDGTYSFATVGGDSNFVLTPSRGGWTFAPVTRSYTPITGNMAAQDFTGTRATYSIGGTVTDGVLPIQNVTMTLTSGGITKWTATTAVDGTYSFVTIGGDSDFVLTPTKAGWTSFAPVTRTYTQLSGAQAAQDFTGTRATYSIGGTVTDGVLPIQNVTMTLTSGGITKWTATTAVDGTYSFATIGGDSDFVLTPTKAGWTSFAPVTRTYTQLSGAQAAQDFTGTRATYSIGGTVTDGVLPIQNVTMTLTSGGITKWTATTAVDGTYSFATVGGDSNFVLTPSRGGWTFAPVTRSYTPITGNMAAQDFTGTRATYSIGGTVTDGVLPIQNVTMTLTSGGITKWTATTAVDGTYSFATIGGDSDFVLTPTKAGWTSFAPVTRTYTQLSGAQAAQDFTGTRATYSIGGTVTDGVLPIQNVTMTLTSGGITKWTATTAVDGTYSFATVGGDSNFVLTPSRGGWTFAPVTRSYTPITGNMAAQDFTGTRATYSIGGTVTDGVLPIQNVTMTLTSGGITKWTATTAVDGTYSFVTIGGDSDFVLTPTKAGWTSFAPVTRTYTQLSGAQAAQDFTGTRATYSIGGTVTDGVLPIQNVTMTLTSGGITKWTATTAVDGTYSFATIGGDSDFVLTPTKAGWTSFAPVTRTYTQLSGAQAAQDFTGTRATYSIGGTVTDGVLPIQNVTMTLTSGGITKWTATTAVDGTYSFATVGGDSNFVLTPSRGGWTFAPVTRSYTPITGNMAAQDFTGTRATYSIGGTVTDGVLPIQNVTMTLTSGGITKWTATTAVDGTYSFATIGGDSDFVLTPTKAGWTSFAPVTRTYTQLSGAQAAQDFTGTRATYSIGGTVTDGVLPIQNVTMTLTSGGITKWTATTAVDGTYSFATVGGDSNFVLTPSRGGWTFAPVTRSYTPITGNMAAQDFTGTRATYSIGGTVTDGVLPIQNVTMTLTSGGITKWTATTAVDGTYSFATIGGDSDFVLTPTKAGWTSFAPVTRTYTQLSGAQAAQDFTGTRATYSIGGTVTDGVLPIQNVTMTLTSGGITKWTATTAVDGTYSFATAGGDSNFVLTPSRGGWTFAPVNIVYSPLTGNQLAQDFTGTINKYTISGMIDTGGVGLAGVAVTLSGGKDSVYTTIAGGAYSFTVNATGNYTVTPTKAEFSFIPINQTFNNVTSNQTQNFVGTINKYTISGVVDTGGTGLAGVAVTLSGGKDSVYTTIAGGVYSFSVNATGNYTVTPTKTGFTFAPINQIFNNVLANQTQNFSGTINKYTISGMIDTGGVGLVGVTVTLSGGKDSVLTTIAGGVYQFTVNATGNYTVTPTWPGYMFNPMNQVFNNVISNQIQNFTAIPPAPVLSFIPISLDYGNTKINLDKLLNDTISNTGIVNARIDSIRITGLNASNFTISSGDTTNCTLIPGQYRALSVKFAPQAIGLHTANLTIYSNAPGSPTNVALTGTGTGTAANITLDKYMIDYGTRAYLNPSYIDTIINITNNSLDTLNIYGVSVDSLGNMVQVIGMGPLVVFPNGSSFINLRFIPNRFGPFTTSIRITNSSLNSPTAVIQLFGTIFGSTVDVTPVNIDFGNAGFASLPRDTVIQVLNTGTASIQLNSVTFSPVDSAFVLKDGIPPAGILIVPGSSQNLTITMRPNRIAYLIDTLRINTNASNTPNPIILRVNVIPTNLNVPRDTIKIAGLPTDSVSALIPIIIRNNSSLSLRLGKEDNQLNSVTSVVTIFSKTLEGDTSSYHFVKNNSNVVLNPGQADTSLVEFRPRTSGIKNASIIVNTDDISAVRIINLSGSANGNPIIYSSTNSIFIGDVIPARTKDTILVLKNTGNFDLDITAKSFAGNDNTMFSFLRGATPILLKTNETDTIGIRFTAGSETGIKGTQLRILSNDPVTPELNLPLSANVKASVISKNANEIYFPITEVGDSILSQFVIKNLGNDTLKFTSIAIEGPANTDYKILTADPLSNIVPGAERAYQIKFLPSDTGNRLASVSIFSNDPLRAIESIRFIGYTRPSTKPNILISTDNIYFGFVQANVIKDTIITIRNTGGGNLTLKQVWINGQNTDVFSFTILSGSSIPLSIIPGASQSIRLRFSPNAQEKNPNAFFNVFSDDPRRPVLNIPLGGTTEKPNIVVSVSELNYGKVVIYDSSLAEITVKNNSIYAKLSVTSIYPEDISLNQIFTVRRVPFPILIDPQAEYKFIIKFSPRALKAYSGNLLIVNSDLDNNPYRISLTGTGIGPKIAVSTSINFGKVWIDSFSISTFNVTNQGEAYLRMDNILFSGADYREFSILNRAFPFNIGPGQTEVILAKFSPKAIGAKIGNRVTVYCNDPDLSNNRNVAITAECINKGVGVAYVGAPAEFNLQQNFPNPFNPSTNIMFGMPDENNVNLVVYDIHGRVIRTLVNDETYQAGTYNCSWDGKDDNGNYVVSGTYFIRFYTESYMNIRKMLLMK